MGLLGKELWINETNAPPSDDPQEPSWSKPRYFRITQAEQAAFVLQEFSLAFAAGASRVEFYKLRNSADHPESIEPYGLLRADDSPRPALAAYSGGGHLPARFSDGHCGATRGRGRGHLQSRRPDNHCSLDE